MQGLNNIRVVDFSSWLAGPYSTKLFADAGADVIKVESEQGDPLRHWSSAQGGAIDKDEDSAFFRYLNGGKRSVQGLPDTPAVQALIAGADLLVEDFDSNSDALQCLAIDDLRKRHPQLVILSISPFGRRGPYAQRPATEFTIQAESGSIAARGLPTEQPFMAGGRISDFLGGTYAAVAALAAVRGAQHSGRGEHIDFSLTEVMNIAATIYMDLMFSLMGRPEIPGPLRSVEVPSIEPTKDGWVGFNTNSRQQFNDFLLLIERPDLLADEELASVWSRLGRMDEWNRIVRAWTRQHSTADIIAKAALFRIPVAPLNNGCSVLEHEQFRARGVFEQHPGGDFMQPRPPYLLNGQRLKAAQPAPHLGQHTHAIETRQRPTPTPKNQNTKDELPLQGLRILDATAWWAGPAATQMLATLGAEVIHLESIARIDGGRTVIAVAEGDHWWERSHLYQGTNTNKQALTLELNQPEGMALMHQLIGLCDVIIENFSPRVFDNFGLDRDHLLALNPDAVYVRLPAFGLDGPWRDHVGFAQTMEQMSGLAWLTGHRHDQCRIQRGPCDPLAGMHAAFAVLVALNERDASGNGQFVECAMIEGALNAAAEQVVEFSAYGKVLERDGNRSPYAAPQGLYRCAGEDNWLALSVASDAQWQALVALLGQPAWAQDPALAQLSGRRDAHDLIDGEITRWSQQQPLPAVVDTLLAHGIAAAALLDSQAAYRHPQLQARCFFEQVEHPITGRHAIPGAPFRFASRGDKGWIYQHAPTLGQHNRQLLGKLLGLSDSTLDQLEKKGVIGTHPSGL